MKVSPVLLAALLMLIAASAATAAMTSVPLNLADWDKHNSGAWEQVTDGIILYGSEFRVGNYASTKQAYDFTNSELFFKWQINGAGSYSYVGLGIGCGDSRPMMGGAWGMTTHHSWEGSRLISENVSYYTRIKVNSDSTISSWTSTNDYDTNGGSIVHSTHDEILSTDWNNISRGYAVFQIGDNYGGTAASIHISEVKTTATAVPEPSSILALLCGIGGFSRMALRRKSA